MKSIEDTNHTELLEFLKGQSIQQLKMYCKQYFLKYEGNKVDMVDKIHKIICNKKGYNKMRGD